MSKVFIAGGLRSHIGLKGGIFKNVPAEDLGAALLKKLIEKYNLKNVDEIIAGNAVGTGGNITRLMALKAGVPAGVPCLTVDMQCASAAAAIELAYAKIKSGLADIIVAGGFESSSMQPTRVYAPADKRYTKEGFTVAQFTPETDSPQAMLEGAERTAQLESISREQLDSYVVRSHQLARSAREQGLLKDVVVSLFGSTEDEGIRDRMSSRLAARMPALFTTEQVASICSASYGQAEEVWQGASENNNVAAVKKSGFTPTLTAANSCLINDGAAFVILVSERVIHRLAEGKTTMHSSIVDKYDFQNGVELSPLAEIVAACDGGVEFNISPKGALAVGEKLLQSCGLSPEAISAFEYNEAFAVISAMFPQLYPQLVDKNSGFVDNFNPLGGALAYGHPYGASGAILVLHLLRDLELCQGTYGLCSIAGAGGLGTALLLKRVH